MKSLTVAVPATITNLGAGFDSLGLAVNLFNRFTAEPAPRGLEIDLDGEGSSFLPRNRQNLVYRSMDFLFRKAGRRPQGLYLRFENNIPVGKGLGSSASCVVGGLYLANALLNWRFKEEALLKFAIDLEGHPDNVLPALIGGFTVLALDGGEAAFSKNVLPRWFHAVLLLPEGEIRTKRARQVLPRSVPFKDAVFNLSRSALTVAALLNQDMRLLRVGLQDRLHESYRRRLFPKLTRYDQLFRRVAPNGVAVSGSGPTLVSFVEGEREAHRLAGTLSGMLRRRKLKGGVLVVRGVSNGARVEQAVR